MIKIKPQNQNVLTHTFVLFLLTKEQFLLIQPEAKKIKFKTCFSLSGPSNLVFIV